MVSLIPPTQPLPPPARWGGWSGRTQAQTRPPRLQVCVLGPDSVRLPTALPGKPPSLSGRPSLRPAGAGPAVASRQATQGWGPGARIGKPSWAERRPLGSWETGRLISLEWETGPEGCVCEGQPGVGGGVGPEWVDRYAEGCPGRSVGGWRRPCREGEGTREPTAFRCAGSGRAGPRLEGKYHR